MKNTDIRESSTLQLPGRIDMHDVDNGACLVNMYDIERQRSLLPRVSFSSLRLSDLLMGVN